MTTDRDGHPAVKVAILLLAWVPILLVLWLLHMAALSLWVT